MSSQAQSISKQSSIQKFELLVRFLKGLNTERPYLNGYVFGSDFKAIMGYTYVQSKWLVKNLLPLESVIRTFLERKLSRLENQFQSDYTV